MDSGHNGALDGVRVLHVGFKKSPMSHVTWFFMLNVVSKACIPPRNPVYPTQKNMRQTLNLHAQRKPNPCIANANYIPLAWVGSRVGMVLTRFGLVVNCIASTRPFRYQHVGKCSRWSSRSTRSNFHMLILRHCQCRATYFMSHVTRLHVACPF